MTTNGTISERTPLSVMLFHAAMVENMSISDYAVQLEIGPISLRQFIEGNTQRPRQRTLELIGKALHLPIEEVRRRMSLLPENAPYFGEWLEGAIKRAGFSRARLTRETNISDGALRNYLANRTMPDAHQAQRITEVLGSNSLEVARVIVAQTVRENGGALAPADEAAPVGEGVELRALSADAHDAGVSAAQATSANPDEATLLTLWRQLHPQGRRATYGYIAMLLAER